MHRFDGTWTLAEGPEGTEAWLRHFIISSGTVWHTNGHETDLTQDRFGRFFLVGGQVELDTQGNLLRIGRQGHRYVFKKVDMGNEHDADPSGLSDIVVKVCRSRTMPAAVDPPRKEKPTEREALPDDIVVKLPPRSWTMPAALDSWREERPTAHDIGVKLSRS